MIRVPMVLFLYAHPDVLRSTTVLATRTGVLAVVVVHGSVGCRHDLHDNWGILPHLRFGAVRATGGLDRRVEEQQEMLLPARFTFLRDTAYIQIRPVN